MSRRIPTPLPLLAGLLAVYLVAPLVAGTQQAALADWSAVDTEALLRACAVSVGSATVSMIILALCGIPLGYLLARIPSRAMALLGFIVQLPLALPPLASGILLLFLVGYRAPLGRLAAGALTDSFAGIVLAETFVAAPFLIIAARSAFASMDPALEGVAATLGRRPLEIFLRVSLPTALPGILSGLLLAWLRAFGEFGATVMVAYHPYSLPVYTYVAFGAQGLPAMLPILLPTLALAVIAMALSNIVSGRGEERRFLPRDAVHPPSPGQSAPLVQLDGRRRTGPGNLALKLEKSIDDFRLNIAWSSQARRLAILGPSGSGKSLILKLIAGIERCDAGVVSVGGQDLSRLDPAARAVAYVPQSYGLFPHLGLLDQLLFPAGADPRMAAFWIARLGLQGLERRRPETLSLGQQQRVALARALTRPASLLLLDEPFCALDATLRSRLRLELLALQKEFSGTMVLVTHDPTEAALLADELLVLNGGKSLQTGHTEDVFRRPANEIVARLLGADNLAEGIVAGHTTIALGRDIMLEVAGPALRPGERVGWSVPVLQTRVSSTGAYTGAVESVAAIGMERQITVRFGDTRVKVSNGRGAYACGDPCRFDIDPYSIQVWPGG